MTIFITGAAGFIGFHTAKACLDAGHRVVALDNLTPYYDVALKEARLLQLQQYPNFTFYRASLTDRAVLEHIATQHAEIAYIIHLAAQAGVRYSLEQPFTYAESNLVGQLAILELCRQLPALKHLVYASSSSVYGANNTLPFSVEDRTDTPISLYAATKKSAELMSYTYSHLFQIPTTGLRYFTVYGPWGRPDMAPMLFTKAMLADTPIAVFNHGDMRRNFTYIDDVVAGTLGCLTQPPTGAVPYQLYNIGNDRSVGLMEFIETLAQTLGKTPTLSMQPMQPGDMKDTIADIQKATADFGFQPRTQLAEGLAQFANWYLSYYGPAIPAA